MSFITNIRNSNFARSVFSVGSGNLLAQLIQVVTIPILSRIFTAQMNGEFALATSGALIVVSFATLGLTSAVMVADSQRESDAVFQVAILFEVVVSSVYVGTLLLLSPVVQIFTLSVSYHMGLLLVFLYMVTTNLSLLLYTAVNRQNNNKALMANPILGAASTLLITIPMGLLGCGSVSFLIAAIAAEIFKSAHMFRHVNPFKQLISFNDFKHVVKKYKDFILFQAPAHFVDEVSVQAPNQLFAGLFGTAALGGYSMCMRVMEYPTRLIAAPINTVYFRTANEYARKGEGLSAFTLKLVRLMFLGLALPVLVVVIWGPPLFTFVLGDNWTQAGEFASILAFPIALKFCCTCISYCRIVLEKQKYNLAFGVISFVLTVVCVVGGYALSHDLMFTMYCFAGGFVVTTMLNIGLSFYLMKDDFLKFCMLMAAALGFWFCCIVLKGLIP